MAIWVLALAAAFGASGLLAWTAGLAYVGYDTALIVFVAAETVGLWRRARTPSPSGRRPSLGVIVAAYNEAPALGVTIDALLAQTDRPDRIWLADDGSSDDSAERLQDLYGLAAPTPGGMSVESAVAPGLRWLRLPHRGKARALNAALEQVDTDVVITVDADTRLDPGAIEIIRAAFAADPDLVVGGGVLSPRCNGGAMATALQQFQTYEYVRNFLGRHAWSRLESLLLISGAFAAFRTDAVVAVGGFDPECWVEDYELIHRLHRYAIERGLGWKVRILGRAAAATDAPATLPAFLRQRRRWFAGFLQTQYWNRDMLGAPRFGALGTTMMPVKAFDTLQPIYGLTAIGLLVALLAAGRFDAFVPASAVMAGKIGLDFANAAFSIAAYRRWTGDRNLNLGTGLLLMLVEPFSFQILRHLGAAWGWVALATGSLTWGRSSRTATPADAAGSEGSAI